MREVLRMVESAKIYVVPVFISEGYFTQTVIPRELELQGRMTIRDGKEIYYCDPVGSHPRMTEVLLHRARQVAPDVPAGLTSLFIVGHGTDLNDNSAKAAKEQAARIRAIGDYAQVVSSYMEESPSDLRLAQNFPTTKCCDRAIFYCGWSAQFSGHSCSYWNWDRIGLDSEPGRSVSTQPLQAAW